MKSEVGMNGHPTPQPPTSTPIEDVPAIISRVAAKSHEWKYLPLYDKISLLDQIRTNVILYRDEWESLLCESRGVSPIDPLHAYGRMDAVSLGPYTLANYLDGAIAELKAIDRTGKPLPPVRVRGTVGGKTIVTVFPDGLKENLIAVGLTGEIILGARAVAGACAGAGAGAGADKFADEGPGKIQHDGLEEVAVGGVAGVLGAGNFDAPIEVLCEMFVKSRVCIYKSNPVTALTDTVHAKIFEPLLSRGYLTYLSGGAAVGSALTTHPSIDEIVLTGSSNTLDCVKWGSTPLERQNNRRLDTPLVTKPITAELGGVTPWIVVPSDRWNRKSVDRHARAMVFAKMTNHGYTCVSPQVVIVGKGWEWRDEFWDRVKHWLGQHPGGAPFYPGSRESHRFFRGLEGAEIVRPLGAVAVEEERRQFPILIRDVEADGQGKSVVMQREAWCPVLAEVPLPYNQSTTDANGAAVVPDDPMQFLKSAVQFSEKNIHGSLSTCIIIDDHTVKNNDAEFDAVVASIPYGIVGVNIYPAYSHSMSKLSWGAYPGYTASGYGQIGNLGLFKNVEKTVLRAPFMYIGRKSLEVMSPVRHHHLMSRLATYTLQPGYINMLKMLSKLFIGI